MVLVPVLLLLPFLNKAFHVDDTLFLYTARQILQSPVDFYGFTINWYTTPQPMSEVMQNPPLQGYLLALVGALFGWSEFAMHGAMLLPALALSGLTALLARRLAVSPVWAVLGVGLSPAFFVSATQIMCDITFLALYLAAILAWIRGLDRNDHRFLALAAMVTAAAFLTKYFGLTLVPLLAAYTLFREKRQWLTCAWLLLPIGAIAVYENHTASLYGRGLFSDAVFYAREARGLLGGGALGRLSAGLVFLSACLTIPAAWSWCAVGTFGRFCVAAIFSAAVALCTVRPDWTPLRADPGLLLSVQWSFWLACGVLMLGVLVSEWRRHGDAESLLLTLWIAGTLVFACCFNHYMNARVLLPLAPAVTILTLRSLAFERRDVEWRILGATSLLLGACTLYIAAADQRLANNGRQAAGESLYIPGDKTIWFSGHWGFQYYMEQGGARGLDFDDMAWNAGDILVLPRNNGASIRLPEELIQRYEVRAYPVLQGLTTLNSEVGAGFHADSIGPLPYVLGSAVAEQYGVVWVKRAHRGNTGPRVIREKEGVPGNQIPYAPYVP